MVLWVAVKHTLSALAALPVRSVAGLHKFMAAEKLRMQAWGSVVTGAKSGKAT